jgi:hypothetical protein
LRVGQRVQIEQSDDEEKSLTSHLYSEDPGDTAKLRGTRASLVSKIKAIKSGSISLERPLRFDVKPQWKPRVLSFEPSVSESGVEHLRFEFPVGEYKGHFTELGFNPVALSGTVDCWVRDIRISNAESGPFVTGMFNTVDQVVYETARKPFRDSRGREFYGHHGIYLGGDDNLFTGFDFRMTFVHDISVSRCSGNVIAGGRGLDLAFDHHKATPYENLYTDIDAGKGSRLWASGGGQALGRQCGARGTFWNIRAKSPLSAPPNGWGPTSMNLVALFTTQESDTATGGRWFEAIATDRIVPQDIHRAQLERRRAQR